MGGIGIKEGMFNNGVVDGLLRVRTFLGPIVGINRAVLDSWGVSYN